jgi:hypothetical protein
MFIDSKDKMREMNGGSEKKNQPKAISTNKQTNLQKVK